MINFIIFILSFNILISRNVAVLLGGLGCTNGSYMVNIANMLKDRNFVVIDNIQVDTTKPLDFQARMTIRSLTNDHKINKQDNVILVGHSQGGLRAFKIYELADEYSLLNITAIFTIATPWKGASIISKADCILSKLKSIIKGFNECSSFRNELATFLGISSYSLKSYLDFAEKGESFLRLYKNSLGVEEMNVGSLTINAIEMPTNNIVPIFNITAESMGFFSTFDLNEYALESGLTSFDKELEYRRRSSKSLAGSIGAYRGLNQGASLGTRIGFLVGPIVGAAALGPLGLAIGVIGGCSFGAAGGGLIGETTGRTVAEREAIKIFDDQTEKIKELKDHLKDFFCIIKDLNSKRGDLALTLEDQQLPISMNRVQVDLRGNFTSGAKVEFKEKGIHIIIDMLKEMFPKIENKAIYDNQEVIDYISRSLSDNGEAIIKGEDIQSY